MEGREEEELPNKDEDSRKDRRKRDVEGDVVRLGDIQIAVSDFDTFNARRDPAKAMFAKVFGKEWAEEFVHGFLFSDSVREEDESVLEGVRIKVREKKKRERGEKEENNRDSRVCK